MQLLAHRKREKTKTLLLLVGWSLTLIAAMTTCEENNFERRQKSSQEALDMAPFHFKDDEANATYSLAQSGGKSQIGMTTSPTSGKATFSLVHDGKEILVLEGHLESVFRIENKTLFFAHFSPTKTGCVVAAYDLDNGKEVWRSELEGIGKVGHEQYRNRITIDLSKSDAKGDGVITITGKETYGDYIEVLDQKTGKQLAHRVYRRGP